MAVPLKNEKGIKIINPFQKILGESQHHVAKLEGRKANKIWLDKGSEFYNRSMKWWSQDNDMEMYSTHNEVKSVVAETFRRTLKNEIYKHMTSK